MNNNKPNEVVDEPLVTPPPLVAEVGLLVVVVVGPRLIINTHVIIID